MMAKVRWPFQRDSGQIEVMVVNKVISTVWQVAEIKLSKTISLQDLDKKCDDNVAPCEFQHNRKSQTLTWGDELAQNIFKYKFIESICMKGNGSSRSCNRTRLVQLIWNKWVVIS
jgi:hypothetical protein